MSESLFFHQQFLRYVRRRAAAAEGCRRHYRTWFIHVSR